MSHPASELGRAQQQSITRQRIIARILQETTFCLASPGDERRRFRPRLAPLRWVPGPSALPRYVYLSVTSRMPCGRPVWQSTSYYRVARPRRSILTSPHLAPKQGAPRAKSDQATCPARPYFSSIKKPSTRARPNRDRVSPFLVKYMNFYVGPELFEGVAGHPASDPFECSYSGVVVVRLAISPPGV